MELEALEEPKWSEGDMLVSVGQAVCEALVSAEARGYSHRLSEETSLRLCYVSIPEKIAEAAVKPDNAGEPAVALRENEKGDSILVLSSHGELLMHPFTGCLVGSRMFEDADEDFPRIIAFDLEEYRNRYGNNLPATIDILDLGYWHVEPNGKQSYEPPVADWRKNTEEAIPELYVKLVFYPLSTKEGKEYDLDSPVDFKVPRSWFLERFPTSEAWAVDQRARNSLRCRVLDDAGISDWDGPFRIELSKDEAPWSYEPV